MDISTPPVLTSTSPNAILLPICAALVIAANYVPLLLLLRVKKVAACTLVIVLAVQNALTFINAIIWPNDNVAGWFSGVGLCDMQVAIRNPLATLLASSSAYISWDLAQALDTDNPRLYEPRKFRHRRIALEFLFCFAVPVLQVGLQYIAQTNRFMVVTVYGCVSSLDSSWPPIVILIIWPPIFVLLNCYFAILVIIRLRKHRGVLSNTLSSTGSGLNARRFMKLFFLSICILIIYLPITLYFLYLNVNIPYERFSWSRVHDPATWNQIGYITSEMATILLYEGWIGIFMACFLVFLYGLNREGRDIYKGWLVRIGLGKFFPSLLEARELPMHNRDSSSRSSWVHRFDMVSRVIHYYDSSKKGSHTATLATMTPRKGSGATFEHAISPSSKPASTDTMHLELLALSSTGSEAVMTPALVLSRPEPLRQAPLFGSPFRTYTNLPYILFSSNNPTINIPSENIELQRQRKNIGTSLAPQSSVETTVWSSADPEVELDLLAPRMGTRAYRERERCLYQQREIHLGVIPDTVTVDFNYSHSNKDEIKVEQTLQMTEELTPPRSSSA